MLAALRSGAPKMSNSKRDRMTRIVFNSGDFAPGVAEEKRRKLWIDLYSDIYGTPDVRFLENRPFQSISISQISAALPSASATAP
jgi:hypothetical protein